MMDSNVKIHQHRERLRFRSHHRGTKEMDLLLGSFADRHIASFGLAELADYEQLLGEQDPDLYNWVTRQDTPPAEKQTAVLALFLQHQLVKTA
jgi:antitoxin CptB